MIHYKFLDAHCLIFGMNKNIYIDSIAFSAFQCHLKKEIRVKNKMAVGIVGSAALPQTIITWLFSNAILQVISRKLVVTNANRY